MTRPGGRFSEFLAGARLPLDGLVLLFRAPGALVPALLPVVLTAVATIAATVAAVAWSGPLAGLLWARPRACDGCGLLARFWAWVATGSWELYRLTLSVALVVAAALVVSRVVSAPLMSVLAGRSLRALGVPTSEAPLLRALATQFVDALLRALLYLAGLAVALALVLVPGGAMLLGPLGMSWTAAWLFADTVVYPLECTGPARLAEVRALAHSRPWQAAGFAISTALLMAVPLAGFLVTPAAVAGACLLVERAGPQSAAAAAVA